MSTNCPGAFTLPLPVGMGRFAPGDVCLMTLPGAHSCGLPPHLSCQERPGRSKGGTCLLDTAPTHLPDWPCKQQGSSLPDRQGGRERGPTLADDQLTFPSLCRNITQKTPPDSTLSLCLFGLQAPLASTEGAVPGPQTRCPSS